MVRSTAMARRSTGFTLWLTGLSGAGKSTLARALADALQHDPRAVQVLDGDEFRRAFGSDLGFTPADRARNVRRIGYVAQLLSSSDVIAIVAAMSPERAVRDEVRRAHTAPFLEILVDCPVEELVRRDPKGIYARAQAGTLRDVVGVDAVYEPPVEPDVHLRTDRTSVADGVAVILAAVHARGLVAP
jgi:adenylyl-sulfate kinase